MFGFLFRGYKTFFALSRDITVRRAGQKKLLFLFPETYPSNLIA